MTRQNILTFTFWEHWQTISQVTHVNVEVKQKQLWEVPTCYVTEKH